MSVHLGLLVTLEAKPDRADDVAKFLLGGLAVVAAEPGTVTWYAIRQGPTTFGIFDTFRDEDGRQAHLSGQVAAALGQISGDLLAAAPDIRPIDILAAKGV